MSRLLALVLLGGLVACGDKEYVPTEDPIDVDGDGFPEDEDCDDLSATVNPGAVEVCDEIDNNCDGQIDEGAGRTYYADADGDGYGLTDSTTIACEPPSGYAEDDGDCDDTNAARNPGYAIDECDEIDNDCDDAVDEDVAFADYYRDDDGDGFGQDKETVNACAAPSGYAADSGDCDDTDENSFPGAPERCDSADNDCDGVSDNDVVDTWYSDADSDAYGDPNGSLDNCDPPDGYVVDDSDCDDSADDVNPDAPELCDGADNNCDDQTDEDQCYTSWDGQRHYQSGADSVPTTRDCELFWTISGTRIGYATEECVDCEFAFDIAYTYDDKQSYDNGLCANAGAPVGISFNRELAYNPSYGVYGPVWYKVYPGYGWVPYYLAGAIKGGKYAEESGYKDYPFGGFYYTSHQYEYAYVK